MLKNDQDKQKIIKIASNHSQGIIRAFVNSKKKIPKHSPAFLIIFIFKENASLFKC